MSTLDSGNSVKCIAIYIFFFLPKFLENSFLRLSCWIYLHWNLSHLKSASTFERISLSNFLWKLWWFRRWHWIFHQRFPGPWSPAPQAPEHPSFYPPLSQKIWRASFGSFSRRGQLTLMYLNMYWKKVWNSLGQCTMMLSIQEFYSIHDMETIPTKCRST